MDPARASMTAIGTALMRAVHTRLDRPPLIDDPWGDRLILGDERDAMLAVVRADDLDAALRAHPSYGTVILRTRYAEDALADVVAGGTRQYVIVGAGMDSFALRRPMFARDLEIFEIDHPATQVFKLRRLADCGIPLPPDLHLVAADLSETVLDEALATSPWRSDRPTFFSWLGVTPYLTPQENLATLRAIASCGSAATELVFSYIDQGVFDRDAEPGVMQEARAALASAGEPWVSGFHPAQLPSQLRAAGLELVEDLGPDELYARYCADRTDGLTPSPSTHVAWARAAA
jgi:methyltransferase (TIGR00027 family)